jgi:anti-sigma regulatory factor (Ser/Thr protein kinase)
MDLKFRYLALGVVAAVCRGLRQPAEIVDAVASAVGEAFNNAVIHADGPSNQGEVEIEIEVRDGMIEIRVADYGAGFSLDKVASPALDPPSIDSLPERGMGLFIIQALMTQVDYVVGRPNVLRMSRALVPSRSSKG